MVQASLIITHPVALQKSRFEQSTMALFATIISILLSNFYSRTFKLQKPVDYALQSHKDPQITLHKMSVHKNEAYGISEEGRQLTDKEKYWFNASKLHRDGRGVLSAIAGKPLALETV